MEGDPIERGQGKGEPLTRRRDVVALRRATHVAASQGVFVATVRANLPICREHYRLVLAVEGFPPAEPGQFVQIRCAEPDLPLHAGATVLRRPFSIGGLRRTSAGSELDIIHRVIGPGTRWMAELRAGEAVSILGPQGRPFVRPLSGQIAMLVGGGVGLPPILWLARVLGSAGVPAVAFCGARSADLLPLTRRAEVPIVAGEPGSGLAEFADAGVPVAVCTDDGSLGLRGRLPDLLQHWLTTHPQRAGGAVVYTCGPERMMQAVAGLCDTHGIACQVCLERMMGCGMGTCQSCVVRLRDRDDPQGWHYALCCTDGPVFDSRQVIWDEGSH